MRGWITAGLLAMSCIPAGAKYCHIPPGLPEDAFFWAIPQKCKAGDTIAIEAIYPEYVARVCDRARPITPVGRSVVCSIGEQISGRRDGSGATRGTGQPAVTMPR